MKITRRRAADISRQAENRLKPHLDALKEHRDVMTGLSGATIWITNNVATVGFFLILTAWTASWFIWNMFAPGRFRFDNSPSFNEWALASSILQLLLLPLILIGQKLESKEAHLRAEADLEINKQAEKENREILHRLEAQDALIIEMNTMIKKLCENNGVPVSSTSIKNF